MKHMKAWAVMSAMALFGGCAAAQIPNESADTSQPSTVDWTIDLPVCKQDLPMWKAFSPWHRLKRQGRSEAWIASLTKHWREADAVDVTWVDIDGDGWCDAITSGTKETHRQAGKPIMLYAPRGIYLRTDRGFKPFKDGMITSEYEGSSFTIYWDNVSKSAVIYKHIWQGNFVGGGGDGGDEFHVRQMLRAMFAAHKAGQAEEEFAYFIEVDPFLYTHQMPHAVADRIWQEEARRAGVDLQYPYLY
ncbi:MAG: hypothetical protein IBJ04_14420 [Hydrogenophaga sp.]|uniref:hypothetical protein n=1 Tax=Hydrogenophaga sp. TaxID=1904254 RepID=UPI00257B383C|nr:hypothetical protein [Hydrogenophaga sp.]MBL0945522.1 hypothetical protein [Hydrogenophaga sp.]